MRRSQPVQGAYLIDVNAMVFGMPRALFPALAATVFGGGATTVGLLYAAPGAGALVGALTTGWVGRVRRQGLAVICAVLVWGLAIAGFGIAHWLPLALLLLAVAGWADVLSAVFRNTIIQFAGPDGMRGRLMGVQMAVVAGRAATRGPGGGRGRDGLRRHGIGRVGRTRLRRGRVPGGLGAARVHPPPLRATPARRGQGRGRRAARLARRGRASGSSVRPPGS